MQKSYDTYEKHIAGMRKHMTGWKSPHMEKLLAATQSDSVLISHIYERCAPRPYTADPWHERLNSMPRMRDMCHAKAAYLNPAGMQGFAV